MPIALTAGTDPVNALYRDRLINEKRANFLFDRFTGQTSKRDDAMIGRDAWPREVLTSDKPILEIPMGDGKYKPSAVGTNKWRMGMKGEYNTVGVAGDATAKDTGTLDTVTYHELITHRRRLVKPLRAGRWNESLGGDWALQLIADSGPDLTDLHMRDKAWNGICYAIYYGHSFHIVYDSNMGGATDVVGLPTAAANGGLGETVRLHPNFCIPGLPAGTGAGYRYADWNATHATYMAAIAVNLTYMDSSNQFKCGINWLRICEQELRTRCRIGRMNKKAGQPEFWLAVTDGQWSQLLNDPTVVAQIIKEHPSAVDQSESIFGNASFRFGGLRVFRGGYRGPTRVYSYYSNTGSWNDTLATENGPGLATDSGAVGNAADTVVFGFVADNFSPYNMVDSSVNESYRTDNGDYPWLSRDVAIGGCYRPMLHGLQRYGVEFFKEEDDFGNQEQMALDTDYGFSRKDYYNATSPASATAVTNDTSILFASYSPLIIET